VKVGRATGVFGTGVGILAQANSARAIKININIVAIRRLFIVISFKQSYLFMWTEIG